MTNYDVRLLLAQVHMDDLHVTADGNRHRPAGSRRRGEQRTRLQAVNAGTVRRGRQAVGTWFIQLGHVVGGSRHAAGGSRHAAGDRRPAAGHAALHRGGEPCSC
jgi:hypothetical protein